MKNKRKIINKFLSKFFNSSTSYLVTNDNILYKTVYYFKHNDNILLDNYAFIYNSDVDVYTDLYLNKEFTLKQFAKHILRFKKIKVFW